MWRVLFVATLMAMIAVTAGRESAAGEPEGDCTTVLFDLDDCIPFITAGSEKKNPTKECCSSFKRVLKSDAECACEAMQLSSEMGLGFDRSRVLSLPSACRLSSSYPPIPDCHDKAPVVEPPSEAPSANGGSPASSPSRSRVIAARSILFLVGIFLLSFSN